MLPIVRNQLLQSQPVIRPSHRLDPFFDAVFGTDGASNSRSWSGPALSIWEDDDRLYVEAELPGVLENDVEITVHDGRLLLKAHRRPAEGRKYLHDGRVYGEFQKTVQLPEAVNTEQVEAQLADGILTITLPKRPEAKPRKVSVTRA